MERWHGKVAVVTGASAGIGLATAKQLVHHGLIVIGLARRVEMMKESMKDVEGPGKFYAKECDISNEQSVNETFDWIKKTFTSINILINNAATLKCGKIEDSSVEDLESVFKVNVFGLLYCSKQAIKMMRENANEAHIVNICSVAGHNVPSFSKNSINVYPASKFAVKALSESLTNELVDSRIRLTNVSPGPTDTDMFDICRTNISVFKNWPALSAEDLSSSIIHAISAPPHGEINEIIVQSKVIR